MTCIEFGINKLSDRDHNNFDKYKKCLSYSDIIQLVRAQNNSSTELGKRGTNFVMNNITEAFKGKTLVITGGTGSFASA